MAEMQRSLTSPPPGRSLVDDYYDYQGFAVVPPLRLYTEMLNTNLAALGPDIRVPVFIFQGAEDPVTPASLVPDYFQTLAAPKKELVLLEGGGHFAVWSMADRFLQELTVRVRPLALQP
jgi:pimeloyl-ACP methyl ester carboxylesterase